MKKLILLQLALLPFISFGQILFSFENGLTNEWVFSAPDRWSADDYLPLNGMYSLHHSFDNSIAATDVAAFSISGMCPDCANITWSFKLRHGYNPSASNKWAYILCADLAPGDIKGFTGFDGFAAGVNLSGYDDTLRLYRVTGTSLAGIITTEINWEKDIGTDEGAAITITRSTSGQWSFSVYDLAGNIRGVWTGSDTMISLPLSSGIVYSYTSSADRLLWIDDLSVSGEFVYDESPPEVLSVEALSYNTLQVKFDEEISEATLKPQQVVLGDDNTALSTSRVDDGVYSVEFARPFRNKTELEIHFLNLCDSNGNCNDDCSFTFIPVLAETGDVIISEIMFDPTPSRGLPEKEYVELFNRTSFSYSTSGWFLIAGSDTSFFPDSEIGAGERVILCSNTNVSSFEIFGKVMGLKSFPGLNDTGEKIAIRNGEGMLIHALLFGPELYNDNLRTQGGWSVEMTDTSYPFNTPYVWKASTDPSGGTPGRANASTMSVPDYICPKIVALFPADDRSIEIWFDETMTGAVSVEEIFANEISAVSVASVDIADMKFVIRFDEPFDNGIIYGLTLPEGLADFAGNKPCSSSLRFAVPCEAKKQEMIFNEILFNPVTPCEDYIELYNNSVSAFNLNECYITSSDAETGEESAAVRLSSFPRLILPGEIVAVTTDSEALMQYYSCSSPENIVQTEMLPSMPDDAAVLSLYNADFDLIDKMSYSKEMHLIFLSGVEGVSLEKASPSLQSSVASNWHSATEACNWGTPGAPNSILLPSGYSNGVQLSSDRVSPDGDGYEDIVSVDVFPGGDENVITIKIFSDKGFLVRTLTERFFAGPGERFVWDGTDDDGRPLHRGLYLIIITAYNTQGELLHWKRVCAVLYR